MSITITTYDADAIKGYQETSGVCGYFRLVCFQKRGGWTDSREGVCVHVCWKGGGEVGSKAQDAAQRASGDLTNPVVRYSRVHNEESFRKEHGVHTHSQTRTHTAERQAQRVAGAHAGGTAKGRTRKSVSKEMGWYEKSRTSRTQIMHDN